MAITDGEGDEERQITGPEGGGKHSKPTRKDGYTKFAKEDQSRKNKTDEEGSNLQIKIHLDLVADVELHLKAQLYGDIVIGLL